MYSAALKVAISVAGLVFLLVVLLDIWYFTILLACYRYLHDNLAAATSLPTAYKYKLINNFEYESE